MNHVPLLIYGATFWGMGFAACRHDVLVVSPSINPGHEFADVFCDHVCSSDRLQTSVARAFYRQLLEHNAIFQGRLHSPALVPLLCGFSLEHKINMLLEAVLVEDKYDISNDGVHQVSVMTTGGLQQWTCDQIFNTLEPSLPVQRKEFNAILHSDSQVPIMACELGFIPGVGKDFLLRCTPGRFVSEAVLHLSCPPETDYPEARQLMEKYWLARPAMLETWRIAAMAQDFFVIQTEEPESCHDMACFSQGFGDPLSAMDAGARGAQQ